MGADDSEGLGLSELSPYALDRFGCALAVSGDTLLVGAMGTNHVGFDAGIVYVYERARSSWRWAGELRPDPADPFAYFGNALALSGDHALVLDTQHRGFTDWVNGPGNLDLYERTGGTWRKVRRFGPGAGLGDDARVDAAAVDGDRAVLTVSPGSELMVLEWSVDGWDERARVLYREDGDNFSGSSVALSGDRVLIGGGSLAAVIEREGSEWRRVETLSAAENRYYARVDLDGSFALVGDRVFRRENGGAWVVEADLLDDELTGVELDHRDYLNGAIDGARIGLHRHNTVRVFVRDDDARWIEEGRFSRPESSQDMPPVSDQALVLEGDTIVIGSPADNSVAYEAGVAHVFELGGAWKHADTLRPDETRKAGGCRVGPRVGADVELISLVLALLLLPGFTRRRSRARAWRASSVAGPALLLSAPLVARDAEACSTLDPTPGLSIAEEVTRAQIETLPLPTDGVLVISAIAASLESAENALDYIEHEVRDGDNTIPGSLEVREVYTDGSLRRGVLFLWRPDEALAPNHEYQLELSAAYGHVGVYLDYSETLSLSFSTGADQHAPLGELELELDATTANVETLEEVCCDVGGSSCGYEYICVWSSMREEPALRAVATIEGAPDEPQLTHVWVTRVGPDGVALDPADPLSGGSPYVDEFLEFRFEPVLGRVEETVVFSEVEDEYCVIVGATSLIDNETITLPPQCVAHSAATTPEVLERTPDEIDDALMGGWECTSAPVYKSTGEQLFPREEEAGCRVTGSREGARSWLLLALLPALRRRR
ncbi:MAG: FG-GAP repeat protein, partial [Myxococcales bacterium]|nr:FG-GAP repeat protein [Myxococcales bacterium]